MQHVDLFSYIFRIVLARETDPIIYIALPIRIVMHPLHAHEPLIQFCLQVLRRKLRNILWFKQNKMDETSAPGFFQTLLIVGILCIQTSPRPECPIPPLNNG